MDADRGQPGPSAPRVLVVDDYQDGADSLTLMLCALGADARAAYDGQSAVASAREFRPALVLLDLSLAGVSGIDIGVAIRSALGAASPRLVALSGWSDEATRERTAAAGFDGHLAKPVELETIRSLLQPFFL
jgi:CheY-like chemotaxis protein